VDSQTWDARRLSFGPVADLYDRVRPRYPVEALRWMLGDHPVKVVDLGAGTGILSRQLAELGHEVIAVEPDAGMRARHGSAVEGSAEHIPLPDGAVDAVVAGQAYHWFDRDVAHREIARVLRLGGTFAPVWNIRDEGEPWLARLSELMEESGDQSFDERNVTGFGKLFSPLERALFRFTRTCTPDLLVELIQSRSYYQSATPERQAEIERSIRRLAREHPDLADRDEFPLPYTTYAYRASRIPLEDQP
jgi:SAM-dependent methyltransferase